MLRLDKPPEICRMIFHGIEKGIQSSVVSLASLLEAGSYIFYRSGSEDAKKNSDLRKASFCIPEADSTFSGDWITILYVYNEWLSEMVKK